MEPLALFLFEALQRNWAMVAIVSTIAILLLVPLVVIRRYVRIALNILRTTRPPLARGPADFVPLSGEPVSFPAYDGLPLHGMVVRADASVPRRGMILFAHEFCSDMYSCARYCRPLVEAGYDIFAFDFRGHGQSPCSRAYTPRQWVTDRERDDMRGATAFADAWLEERGLPVEYGLVGVSRGACAAIIVMRENPNVRAIVADGAFSTDSTIEYFMHRWAFIFSRLRMIHDRHPPAFWRFLRWWMICHAQREFRCRFPSVRKAIQRMTPRPMLFIHGVRDSYLPVEQSKRLYALAGQPKSLWIAPDARHNEAVIRHPSFYARLTVEFFDRHLARPLSAAAEPAEQPAEAAAPVAAPGHA